MNDKISWSGNSLVINDLMDLEIVSFLETMEKKGIKISSENIIDNQENYYIYENDFIKKCTNLNYIIEKYNSKNYDNLSSVYLEDTKDFEQIDPQAKEVKKYNKILEDNIIYGGKEIKNISVNILNKILDDSSKSRFFIDFLIVSLIATKTKFNALGIVKSEIKMDGEKYEIPLKEMCSSQPLHLYRLYDWIINEEEYEDAYILKLNIIRKVILNKKNIKDVDDILEDSKVNYKQINSKKTDEYFKQLNILKDDYLKLSTDESNIVRSLNFTVFAWLGYLGIEFFNIVSQYEGDDIMNYLLFSKGEKKGIVIFLFIIALLIIFVVYYSEFKSLTKIYDNIRSLYKDKIFFESKMSETNKFDSIIKKPEFGVYRCLFFVILLLILLWRFYNTFPW